MALTKHHFLSPAKGRPVVLLLFNAGPLNIKWADESPDVHAIVECWLPAQATGLAVARFMTNGPEGNPAGRLPYTWPASMDDVSLIYEDLFEEVSFSKLPVHGPV